MSNLIVFSDTTALFFECDMEWTSEDELQLFFALEGLKPVGINKHFHVACLVERLSNYKEISAEAVWSKLRMLYNLEVLEENEKLPFPNEKRDFELPDDIASFLSKKRHENEKRLSTVSSPSIIALSLDNTAKEKPFKVVQVRESVDRKGVNKTFELSKRTPKRTRGSISLESSSPSTTPPPISSKRRRI